jgi:hypothetical protein
MAKQQRGNGSMNDYVQQLKMQLTLSGVHVHEDMPALPAPVLLLESGQVVMARVYRFASKLDLGSQVKLISQDGDNFKYYQHVPMPDTGEGLMQLRCAVW